ncbi:MAG TPA: glycoside hydrolase 100 family protein [Verrucomicrobiae bacterium]|nr:glycoside hydrolase 100 family protein [Verrucomicrobiae bacterium]
MTLRYTPDEELLAECRRRSLELLRANCTPHGFLAATRTKKATERHYASIFGRDAAICAIGACATREPDLVQGARDSLLTLARFQAVNGQIPKFVKPETEESDFWYSGCIDATLWWLIGVKAYDRLAEGGLQEELGLRVERAIHWLLCQEHQTWRLLQQNEASDWADIMPRSGFVLYTNALWYRVKRLYGLPGADETRDYANFLFHPYDNTVAANRRARLLAHYIRRHSRPSDFYLSFVNFSFWGEEGDIFGNVLAALAGIPDSSRSGRIASAVTACGAASPYPVRAVAKPLAQKDPLWRRYMERHRQNLPYCYHNGGSWPFIGGFWGILLWRMGKKNEALQALEGVARASRVNGWEFNEWFNGESGEPSGMPGQSWNAALFLAAWCEMREGIRAFD